MRPPSARRDAMLEFVLLAAQVEGPRPFPETVVDAMRAIVPCDTLVYRAWRDDHAMVDESFAPAARADWLPVWAHYPSFRRDDPHPSLPPSVSDPRRPVSAAGRTARPLVLSDAVSPRRFRQTGLYFELMRPFGVRDVLKVFLPRYDGVGSAFVFDTSGSFSATDRALVARLVPPLVQFQRNAHLRSQVLAADGRLKALTPRELTVLGRAAAGETNAEIAAALVVNASTVRKHLEHVYEKLGVRNRSAAAGIYRQARG